MRTKIFTVATCLGLLFSGILGIDSASAQSFTYNISNQTFAGFNLVQPSATGFSGTLTAVSVNVILDASVNNTKADDICIYVDYAPLSTGGLVQVGGVTSLSPLERYSWPNGGSDTPGTACIGTVNLTTPITFSGTFSDPVLWIGNGNSATGTSGTWSGSLTLTGISAPGCVVPSLSAMTTATACQGTSTGAVNLTITGGSPLPLFISWSNGASTEDLTNVNAGTYTVTVTTLGGGCSATGSYTIENGPVPTLWYADSDGDGYGDPANFQSTCVQPLGFITDNADCNDGYNNVNPGMASDLCDGLDNDCDGSVDEDGTFLDYYMDADGDGYGAGAATSACAPIAGSSTTAGDCNDNNNNINPGMSADLCDGLDNDCDSSIDEDGTFLDYYVDVDGDGYGAGAATSACSPISGSSTTAGDCNDSDNNVNPGMAADLCDGLDNDCDGSIDEDATFLDYYVDGDGDGFGAGASTSSCSVITGSVTTAGDCNDGDNTVNPGIAVDLCNGVDDDCDGSIDEDATFMDYYVDGDGDGYGAGAATSSCSAITGSVTTDGDCNDGDNTVNPGVAADLCNGVDDDCDSAVDEDVLFLDYYVDGDNDGYGAGAATSSCSPINGSVTTAGDCNDGDNTVNPGVAADLCNGVDDDCDSAVDEDVLFLDYYVDGDNDGYGAGAATSSCSPINGSVTIAGDCNDGDNTVNPGVVSDLCNGLDDDCDGAVDEDVTFLDYYIDADSDGYGAGAATSSCAPITGSVTTTGDCNDGDNTVNPGVASDLCNSVDNDCDGSVDEDAAFLDYYVDGDNDGFGAGLATSSCASITGSVNISGDCDDNDSAVYPGTVEVCNGYDDNCDGVVDDIAVPAIGPISGPYRQCIPIAAVSTSFSVPAVSGVTTYVWSLPPGLVLVSGQGTNSINVTWTSTSAHEGIMGIMSVTPGNGCGTGTPSTVMVDLHYGVPVRPSSISGPSKVCPGDVVTYSVFPVVRATGYDWTLPAGMNIVSGSGTNIISVAVVAGYAGGSIECKANNVCGAGPGRTRSVATSLLTTPAPISGQASGLCGDIGVVYTITPVTGATGYNWTVPAGATLVTGQNTTQVTVDFSGLFSAGSITVGAVNGCGVGAIRNQSLTGYPAQPAAITGDNSICPGQTGVTYSVPTVKGASTYQWTAPNGTTIVSGNGTKEIITNWGTAQTSGLTISVKASNACGTSITRVLNGVSVFSIHCGSPRFGAGSADDSMTLYPNPATDNFELAFSSTVEQPCHLIIFDAAGQEVYSQTGMAHQGLNRMKVNITDLASGIYLVSCDMDGQRFITRLFK